MTENQDVTWYDMDDAPRDGTDIWCYFPLEGLGKGWERVTSVYWREDTQLWTWSGRAVRSYSRGYEPTCWTPRISDVPPQEPDEKALRPPARRT